MTRKLIITKGNVASGKSTYARKRFEESPQDTIIVERDQIRYKLFDGFAKNVKLSSEQEEIVTGYQTQLITDHLQDEYKVIVSDTNLHYLSVSQFKKLADENDAEFEVVDFTDVPLSVCLERNAQRPDDERIPEEIVRKYDKKIKAMKNKKNKVEERPFVMSSQKDPCFVFDLDGTTELMNGRSPFDSMKAVTDLPNASVIMVIKGLMVAYPNATFIALSGREDKAYDNTYDSLDAYGILPDMLFMRETGDSRADNIIKAEIYAEYIEPFFNVMMIFDDRDQVVDMWREKGLHVCQVAPGDF